MFCPYCGTKNDENAAHCINPECNRILPQRQHPGMRPVPAKPADPLTLARTIGGLSGLIGGGMVILGWFMPWLSLSVGGFTLASGGNGPQIVVGRPGSGRWYWSVIIMSFSNHGCRGTNRADLWLFSLP